MIIMGWAMEESLGRNTYKTVYYEYFATEE